MPSLSYPIVMAILRALGERPLLSRIRNWLRDDRFISACSFIVSVCVLCYFVLGSFLQAGQPKGWDTPSYLYYARYVDESGCLPRTGRPLMVLIIYAIYKVSTFLGASELFFLAIAQVIVLTLFIFSLYWLVRVLTGDARLASLTLILAPISPTVLRFQPLMSAALSLAFVFFAISFLYEHEMQREKFKFLLGMVFLAISALTNVWFTLYFLFIVAVGSIVSTLFRDVREELFRRLRENKFYVVILVLVSVAPVVYIVVSIPGLAAAIYRRVLSLTVPKFNFPALWNVFGGFMFVTGLLGIPLFQVYVKDKFFRMLMASWTLVSLLISFFTYAMGSFFRFFILVPFPVTSAFFFHFLYHIEDIVPRLKVLNGLRTPLLRRARYAIPVVTSIILILSFFQAVQWQQYWLGPYLTKEELDEFFWIREAFPMNAVVCVSHDKKDVLFWSQAILESPKRNVYVFFGNLSDLLGGHVRINHDDRYSVNERLVRDGVLKHLEDFTIILPALTYDLSDVEKAFLKKIPGKDIYYLKLKSEEERRSLYTTLSALEEFRIAQIGLEAGLMADLLRELGLRFELLGGHREHLPPLNRLAQYDLLIINSWYVIDEEDVVKLVEFVRMGKSLLVTAWTAYMIYYQNVTAFEILFGTSWADDLSEKYENVTYVRESYFTYHMSLPHLASGPISPLGNLTTGLGFGVVNNHEGMFAVVINERGDARIAAFGKRLANMDGEELILLKKLVLWALHMEIPI